MLMPMPMPTPMPTLEGVDPTTYLRAALAHARGAVLPPADLAR